MKKKIILLFYLLRYIYPISIYLINSYFRKLLKYGIKEFFIINFSNIFYNI